ncbi:hypothetical protein Taro_026829, partial [Colocasia esculenta]|nr:hypothetical protein [Colocasia esculenta]
LLLLPTAIPITPLLLLLPTAIPVTSLLLLLSTAIPVTPLMLLLSTAILVTSAPRRPSSSFFRSIRAFSWRSDMAISGDSGEGPSAPLHPDAIAGTLSSGGPLPPPVPSGDLRGPAAPFVFLSNKPLDASPEPPVNVKSSLSSRVVSTVEEFVKEAVALNLEEMPIEEGLDDGFGIYEIVAEEDPLDENDGEIEDAAEAYASEELFSFCRRYPPYSGPKAARETYADLKQLSAIPGHIYTRPELQILLGQRRFSKMPWLVPMLELLPPTSIGHLKEWGLSTVFMLARNYYKLVHVWESVTAMVELWHPQTN